MTLAVASSNLELTIRIAADFSRYPGVRYRSDGPASGEEFRDDILLPALKVASVVTVDLAGTAGYGSSFLDEAFGGLVREGHYTETDLEKKLKFSPNDSVYAVEARTYISDASRELTRSHAR